MFKPICKPTLILLFFVTSWSVAAEPGNLRASIEDYYASHLEELFIWFHRNPELSFLEHQTAKRLASELRQLGVEVTEGVGGTGIVGVINNGEGPRLLIRADMDGLPVKEDSGLSYASVATQRNREGDEVPVMHACGHDVHITSLVGTAKMLMERRADWQGTVVLIGQPAEERIGGAKLMLEDGLYDRFGVPDYALAFHVSADGPAGKIAVRPGLITSSSDSVDIIVRGVGSHGASPHRGKDPIYMASQLVIALQGIVSRELSPQEPAVITVGSIHGGFKHNIIPDEVKLQLTVRSDSRETRQNLLSGIRRTAEHIGRLNGLPDDLLPIVRVGFESTPVVINDEVATFRVLSAWRDQLGSDRLYDRPREGMGAEDFAYFVETQHDVPGVYFSVGGTPQVELEAAQRGDIVRPAHHSPFFKVMPEPSVITGVEATFLAAMELLSPGR